MAQIRNETPTERAPLLRVFGDDLAGRVAALVKARPILIARLIVAPREFIHATGAFLHHAPDAERPDVEVAAMLNDTDPRRLLNAALPECPARLYRALDRAGDRIRGRTFYSRLGEVARGPFGHSLLESGALDDVRLGYFEALSKMDPGVGLLHSALPQCRHQADAVDSLLAFLRSHGALNDSDLRLPPNAGLPAVARRLQRALGRISAPNPGFKPPTPFKLVTSTDELQSIGKAFGNCVAFSRWHSAEHHMRLINGSAAYLLSDEPPLLVALRRLGTDLWLLEQIAGPKNAAAPDGAQEALLANLAAAGLRILATDPQHALSQLQRSESRSPDGDDDDPDDDGLDDLDDLAA